MSWVYPVDEARTTTRLGIEAAFFWVATVFLLGAATSVLTRQLLLGSGVPWLSLAAIVGLWGAVLAARLIPRLPLALGAVLVVSGAALVGLLGWTLGEASVPQAFPLSAALIATTVLGSTADRWTGAIGTIVSFVLASAALMVIPSAGTPQPAPLVIALVIAGYYASLTVVRRRNRGTIDRLDEAVRTDAAGIERRRLEQSSRALVHDTVLSELVSLGMMRPGPLTEAARESIRRSLDAVHGPADRPVDATRGGSVLDGAVDRAAAAGVAVALTGDLDLLETARPDIRAALVHAVDQALVNVVKHAGVDAAEVSVAASGERLVVAVVDGGMGFVEADIPDDRFGFRESIRGRLESVGGSARILSSPGAGTSILLTAPLGGEP